MRRGARYYLRVRVPLDLIDIIGRQEIWQSLGTGDHREAVRRYFPARTELQQGFEHARRRRAGLTPDCLNIRRRRRWREMPMVRARICS
jgi:hypothetical protein